MIGIEVAHLTRKFGNVIALNDLTVSFAPGMLHGIIGPDGAGKTTLIRILAGLLHTGGGTITFQSDGKIVSFNDIRPQIGYMPSRSSLYPDLTISEHLEFFKDLYQLQTQAYLERRKELLSITRLEDFANRPVGQLSGGMYKKTALMCTLLRSPQILLLDEPTNGVDPISRREFWELLYSLVKKNITVITSTAYMDEAERCSRVHFIDNGRLLLSGEPKALLEQSHTKSFDELFTAQNKV
jgi:ABC-2 type transport system ATP-binding protein